MKIGVSHWIWVAPFRSDQHLELIPRARALGAEVFEFAAEDDAHFDVPAVRRALADAGLASSLVGLYGPGRDLSSADPATRQLGMEYSRRSLDLCAAIGGTLFTGAVVGVGNHEALAPAERDARLNRAADCLRTLGDHARSVGVTFAVEILNRYECNLTTTSAQGSDLIDRTGHPAVGLHLDTFHMNMEEASLAEAIRLAGPRLVHVHASESHRGTPGAGLLRWDQVAAALREIDYRGYAVIESFNLDTWLAPLARFWRPPAASADTLARDGLAFLRSTLRS